MAIFKEKEKKKKERKERKKGTSRKGGGRRTRERGEWEEHRMRMWEREWERKARRGRETRICKVTADPVLFECKSHASRPALYANARLFSARGEKSEGSACSCAMRDAIADSDRRETLVVGVVKWEERILEDLFDKLRLMIPSRSY